VIDLLEIAVAGLQPGQEYQLFLVDSLAKPDASGLRSPNSGPRRTARLSHKPSALCEQW
jgi:hypothetical protein